MRPGMAYIIKLLLADFVSVSKLSEDIDHYIGRHGDHRGSCGEDLVANNNMHMMFVRSHDGDLDQVVGGLEALIGVNDLASC